MKKIAYILTIIAVLSFGAQVVMAHSGGTNAQGCHYDHKNGGYHCH